MSALAPVVLLGAGEARRLGVPKGLFVLDGEPWLTHQLRALASAGVGRVALVLGANRPAYVARWPELARPRCVLSSVEVHVVVNERPEDGPFSSLACGLRALADEPWVAVLPLDVPAPAPETWRALHVACSGVLAVVPEHEGRGGHPVLVARELALQLLALPAASSRLDHVLRALASTQLRRLPVTDPRVRRDHNRAEDFGA